MNPNNFNLLRGALPAPPQIGAPAPPAPIQAVSSAQPTLPYQQQGVGGVVDAIQNFVNNYRVSSESQKQRSMQDAERDLRLLSIGVPINQEKLAKNLKKAGLELDYEAPRPMVADPSRPAQSVVVPTNSPIPGQQDMASQVPQAMMQAPPPPPPGMWDRIKNFAMPSRQPPIAPNSPAMQWIGQLAAQGQQNQELEQKQRALQFLIMDNAKNAQTIMKGVYEDNPEAQRLARQTGLLQMTPYDQFAIAGKKAGLSDEKISAMYLKSIMGPDQMQAMLWKQAGDIADRFGGDFKKAYEYLEASVNGEQPKEQPGRTFKENLDIAKLANEIQQNQPVLSQGQATVLAIARMTGNQEVVAQFDKVLSKLPSMNSMNMLEKQMSMMNTENQIANRDAMTRVAKWNASTAEKGLVLREEANRIEVLKTISNQAGRAFDDAYRMFTSKDASEDMKRGAIEMMANSLNAMPPIQFTVIGKDGKPRVETFDPAEVKAVEVEKWFGDNKFYLRPTGSDYTEGKKPKGPQVELGALDAFLKRLNPMETLRGGSMLSPEIMIPPPEVF